MKFLESPELSNCQHIRHGFFTRNGQWPAVNNAPLCGLRQIHSNIVHYMDNAWDSPPEGDAPEGDAMVTTQKNIALSIQTADCAPILFADPENSVIAAAHAGWQGALNGIMENTLKMMCEKGAQLSQIIACIGPCIAQENYQVSPDFRRHFIEQNQNCAKFFIHQIKENKYLFDLKKYIYSRLSDAGLENIRISPFDTYADEENFFSYRRSTHRGEIENGRQISVILNL